MTKVLIPIKTTGAAKSKKEIKGVGGSLTSLAKSAGLAAGAYMAARGLVNAVGASVTAFAEQQEAEKKLEAVLKSTGHAAGMTADEFKDMASALQQQTKFGDEAIIGAQSLMLTFTKVGKDVMPDAMETVLNMSEAMGTGLKESTIQLGKALNDPVLGISALSRVGVQLSEQQKQQIKDFTAVGDVAAAQQVILGELETQFGGMAKAAGQTFAGSLAQMRNAVGDAGEALGGVLAPALQEGAKFVKKLAEGFTNAITYIQSIDWGGTVSNILNNLSALGKVFIDILGVYWDLIPDLLKDALVFAFEKAKEQFFRLLDLAKMVGKFLWDPLKISAQILVEVMKMRFETMWINIQNIWTTGINGIKELYNGVVTALGGEAIDLTPLIDKDAALANNEQIIGDLQEQLATTDMGQAISGLFRVGEDDITSVQEASDAVSDILTNFWDGIAEKKKEVGDPHGLLTEEEVETENINLQKRSENKDKIETKDEKRESKFTKHYDKMKDTQLKKLLKTEEGQKVSKIRAAIQDSYALAAKAFKSMADIPIVGPHLGMVAAIAAFAYGMTQVAGIKSAATGADFTTSGPELLLVGDNKSGREHVKVTPLGLGGGEKEMGGASIVIHANGNVMTDDFVQDVLIEKIREGLRLGESIN